MYIAIDGRLFALRHGGIARYTQALIRELMKIDSQNHYSVLLRKEARPQWEQLRQKYSAGVQKRWQAVIMDAPHYSYAEQFVLPRVLKRLQPDLVHFTNFNHPLVFSGRFVTTIHDLTILRFPIGKRQQSRLAQTAFRSVIRHALTAGREVLTVSETSKTDLVRLFSADPDRVTVTYEGVDETYQPVNLPQRGRIQRYLTEHYGIRPPFLLFVSQWRPHKGIGTLLAAYEQLRLTTPRLTPQLVLVGQPHPDFPVYLDQIQQSQFRNDIVHPGFVEEVDLPKFYQAAELFAFPSEYEGFGLTPLEAMASGTPVVASASSCLPEILGNAAFFAQEGDIDSWVAQFRRLLTDRPLWRDQRSLGVAHARQFSWRRMAEQTLATYRRVTSS